MTECTRCHTDQSIFWFPVDLGARTIWLCDDCMLQFVLFMKRPFFKFGEIEEI